MKPVKIIFASAAAALAAGCTTDPTSFTVECPVSDKSLEGKTLYISSYEHGVRQRVVTDSAVVRGGEVVFKGNVQGSAIRRLDVGLRYVNFILEPGTIRIDVDSLSATGTPLNDAMELYAQRSDSLRDVFAVRFDEVSADTSLTEDERTERRQVLVDDYCELSLDMASNVVADNKDNAFGQFIFWMDVAYNECITPQRYKNQLDEAGAFIAEYGPVKALTKRFEALERTSVGSAFADFVIEHGNADSTAVKLSDYAGKGKLLLVDMWASWCGPCRRAMPAIKAVYDKYAGDKFEVLSVAVWDNRTDTQRAIEAMEMTWPQILDANDIPTELYGVNSIPHLMLIAADGTILARNLSPEVLDLWVKTELEKMTNK